MVATSQQKLKSVFETIKIWLTLALIAAPIITWGVEEIRMKWAIDAAVTVAKSDQKKICDGRVATISSNAFADAFKTLKDIKEAELGVTPTPTTKPELSKLCSIDRRCRERTSSSK